MIETFKRQIKKFERIIFRKQYDLINRLLVLQGVQAARQLVSTTQINSLSDVGFKVSSQFTEDGIIEWIIQQIPSIPQSFVEFGVEDYTEANTRFLLQHRGWSGLVMDGSQKNISEIRRSDLSWRYPLRSEQAFITRENINRLLRSYDAPFELGLLSIDIDGNEYYVWDAIEEVKPHIVIVEYNAVFGDIYSLSIPYRADFDRSSAHYSNLYFGCSLPALINLADRRGFHFLGTNAAGNNAFFVRNEHVDVFSARMPQRLLFPSTFRETRAKNGKLLLTGGPARLEFIAHMPVVRLDSGETLPLQALGNLYSAQWASGHAAEV